MTHPVNRGPRRCPSCGRAYGIDGARCYPGVPAVRTKNGQGLAARCERDGTLAVPPAMPADIAGVVREFRAAGAGWEVVDAWLRRFGLRRPEEPTSGTARGTWPPRPPQPTTGGPRPPSPAPDSQRGPRPPRREAARPYTYRGDETGDGARNADKCPESTGPHGPLDAAGRCPWCERKVGRAMPPPRRVPPTELGQEYRRHHDPDWGTDHRDV
jgi:hypothetical protein